MIKKAVVFGLEWNDLRIQHNEIDRAAQVPQKHTFNTSNCDFKYFSPSHPKLSIIISKYGPFELIFFYLSLIWPISKVSKVDFVFKITHLEFLFDLIDM